MWYNNMMTNLDRTDLQNKLPEGSLSRGVEKVDFILKHVIDLERVAIEKATRLENGDVLVVADIACGKGNWLKEITPRIQAAIKEATGKNIVIKGIGLDLNPVEAENSDTLTFLQGDATTMEGIEDGTVDIALCLAGSQYVPDMLKALESGFRILNKDGVMVWVGPHDLISTPGIGQVIKQTPGAEEVFELMGVSRFGLQPEAVICRRHEDSSFEGFPYEFEGAVETGWNGWVERRGLPTCFKTGGHMAHFRRGVYRSTVEGE